MHLHYRHHHLHYVDAGTVSLEGQEGPSSELQLPPDELVPGVGGQVEDQGILAQSAEVSGQEESDGEGGAPAGDLQVPGEGEGGPQPGDGGPGEAGDLLELVHHGEAGLAVIRADVEPEGEAEERTVRRRSVNTKDYKIVGYEETTYPESV